MLTSALLAIGLLLVVPITYGAAILVDRFFPAVGDFFVDLLS